MSSPKKLFTSKESRHFHSSKKLNYQFLDKVKFGQQHPLAEQIAELPTIKHFSLKVSTKPLPVKVDLRALVKDVYDQGDIGSCVCNSVAMSYRMTLSVYNNKSTFHYYAWNYKDMKPSRLYLYAYARVIEGMSIGQDCGSSVLSGYRALVENGVPEEKYWPYDTSFYKKMPPLIANQNAQEIQTPGYHKIKNTIQDLKHALANKEPVSFGAVLFKSFYNKNVINHGNVSKPEKNMSEVIGGHCLLIVGYDDSKEAFIVKNSWGEDWGDKGHCYMPYSYITDTDLCADFWSFARL